MKKTTAIIFTLFCLAFGNFAHAAATDNIAGYAWSYNTGWIKLNNCDADQAGTYTCSGTNYGVNVDPTTGAVSGYGWSSNIGWIDFDDTSCGPEAAVNWITNGIAAGTGVWSGYVKALSANSGDAGGWDGCIKMAGSITGGGNYGVGISQTGQFTGYAWNANNSGGVTVGDSWINFSLARMIALPPTIELSVDSWVNGACTSANANQLGLAWNVVNVQPNSCTFSPVTPAALTHTQTQNGIATFGVVRAPNLVVQLQCTGLNNQPLSATVNVSCNACSDGIDNDGDGNTDAADARCNCSGSYNAAGTSEAGGCTTEVLGNRGTPIYEER